MHMKITAVLISLLGSIQAGAQVEFKKDILWDDLQGLKTAVNCQPVLIHQSPLFIVENSERPVNFTTADGKSQMFLSSRALVKLKDQPEKDHYHVVKVINSKSPFISVKSYAPPGAEGYVSEMNLQEATDYVFSIPQSFDDKKKTNGFFAIKDTFWHAATTEDGTLLGLQCVDGIQKKNYTLFNVFTRQSDSAIAQVGVLFENQKIFQTANVISSDEMEQILDEAKNTSAPIPLAQRIRNLTNRLIDSALAKVSKSSPDSPSKGLHPKPSEDTAVQTYLNKKNNASTAPIEPLTSNDKKTDLSQAPTKVDVDKYSDDKSSTGTVVDYLVCTEDSDLIIRDKDGHVQFKADHFEAVQLKQSWVPNPDKTRVEVSFPHRNNQTGFAAAEFIKAKSDCAPYKAEQSQQKPQIDVPVDGTKDLTSEECCKFPTVYRPKESYKTDERKFRANRKMKRGSKRAHAACDLYRKHKEPALAVTSGTVIRNRYFFYQGTFALEVRHTGGQIVRYGEITAGRAPNISADKKVEPGQVLGYIGTVNSGCCEPMLHFELYSGSAKGSLNTGKKPFLRRSDLMDPTAYLMRWEKRNFGESY